jgi:hypothetical protein
MDFKTRKKYGDKVEGEIAIDYVDYGPQSNQKYNQTSGMKKWNPDYYKMEEWIKLGYDEKKAPDFYFSKPHIYVDGKKSIKIIKKQNIENYMRMGKLGGLKTYLMVKQENRGFCMIDVEVLYEEILKDVVWNDPIDNFIDVYGNNLGSIEELWIDVDRDYQQIYDLCIPFNELFT